MENINEFNYKSFFLNIDNFSISQRRKQIQTETNNFDVYLLCVFFSEFLHFAISRQCKERIKYSDLDISFSDNIDDFTLLPDNSLLSYVEYSLNKGKLVRRRINIKYELTEPIEIKYFGNLFDFLHSLGHTLLYHATKEQLDDIFPNTTETKQKHSKTNKSLLFEGKDLNLVERYKIANKVLNIDNVIRKLSIKDLEKYQLLAYILGCDKDNARNLMNGTYKGKDRDLSNYFNDLGLNK